VGSTKERAAVSIGKLVQKLPELRVLRITAIISLPHEYCGDTSGRDPEKTTDDIMAAFRGLGTAYNPAVKIYLDVELPELRAWCCKVDAGNYHIDQRYTDYQAELQKSMGRMPKRREPSRRHREKLPNAAEMSFAQQVLDQDPIQLLT
jgi:hypothetical protein